MRRVTSSGAPCPPLPPSAGAVFCESAVDGGDRGGLYRGSRRGGAFVRRVRGVGQLFEDARLFRVRGGASGCAWRVGRALIGSASGRDANCSDPVLTGVLGALISRLSPTGSPVGLLRTGWCGDGRFSDRLRVVRGRNALYSRTRSLTLSRRKKEKRGRPFVLAGPSWADFGSFAGGREMKGDELAFRLVETCVGIVFGASASGVFLAFISRR